MADDSSTQWQQQYAHVVGRRVFHYRRLRGMSADRLSKELSAELGVDMKRTVIGNLESGYRRTVSVAELLALAHVLCVPPLALMVPLNGDESTADLEILPGVAVEPWTAAKWITGEGNPCGGDPRWRIDAAGRDAREVLDLYRQHDAALGEAQQRERLHDIAMQELAAVMFDDGDQHDIDSHRATTSETSSKLRDADSFLRLVRRLISERDLRLPELPAGVDRRLNEEVPRPGRIRSPKFGPPSAPSALPDEERQYGESEDQAH